MFFESVNRRPSDDDVLAVGLPGFGYFWVWAGLYLAELVVGRPFAEGRIAGD
jgi:hypothetical protein